MRDVSLNFLILAAGFAPAGALAFFALARWGFRRAWDEFRSLRQSRLARASGLLSPALENSRLDPFRHLPREWAPEKLSFSPLQPSAPSASGSNPLFGAIRSWEEHHRHVSRSFFEALGHAAHHRLVPHGDLRQEIEPIGDALLKLVDECPDPSLQKELRLAYVGLKTGAAQNLEYVSRRLSETARESHSAFSAALGNAHSELDRVRQGLIQSVCREADEEIGKFLESHRGFRFNPIKWGRQVAYYREFEQLRDELERSRQSGDLGEIALIVMMIVEDENRFVKHLHAAERSHDELHQRLSDELRKSADQLCDEAHSLSGWASQENQRLQSTVSHQLIVHLETWKLGARDSERIGADHSQISAWIARLAELRDQDPELAAQAS
jgi:hypothetical protein